MKDDLLLYFSLTVRTLKSTRAADVGQKNLREGTPLLLSPSGKIVRNEVWTSRIDRERN